MLMCFQAVHRVHARSRRVDRLLVAVRLLEWQVVFEHLPKDVLDALVMAAVVSRVEVRGEDIPDVARKQFD
jgi:hypothetical protein